MKMEEPGMEELLPAVHKGFEEAAEMAANAVVYYLKGCEVPDDPKLKQ